MKRVVLNCLIAIFLASCGCDPETYPSYGLGRCYFVPDSSVKDYEKLIYDISEFSIKSGANYNQALKQGTNLANSMYKKLYPCLRVQLSEKQHLNIHPKDMTERQLLIFNALLENRSIESFLPKDTVTVELDGESYEIPPEK